MTEEDVLVEPENRFAVTVTVYVTAEDSSQAEVGVSRIVEYQNRDISDVEVYDFDIIEVEPAEVI